MKRLIPAAVLVCGLACAETNSTPTPAASVSPEAVAKASAELNAYLDAEFEEELAMSPEWLTMQGRKEHYDRLDDRTDAIVDRRLAWRRDSVATMKAKFDPATLDEEARTSFEMWAQQLDFDTQSARFRRQPYIFIRNGNHASLPSFLINFHRVETKSDMTAYIARLRALAVALEQDLERAKAAAAEGNRPPQFAFDQAIQECRAIITGRPFGAGKDSPLFADLTAKITKLRDGGTVDAAEAQTLLADATKALSADVKPAYDRVITWLTADRANTTADARGVSTLTDGTNYYNTQLLLQTTTPMTADQIHELGLSEVARLRGEMEQVKQRVGFNGTLEQFFAFMRTSPQFYLPNTDAGRAAYIHKAEEYLGVMKAKLPEYFGLLPKADLVVKRVEPFREEAGGAQHYFAGAPDGSRPGIFYAHLSDMKAMPTFELETVAYHEGVPGHHLQVSIAQEGTGIAKFRGQYGFTAFQEGWGLYSEVLAKDAGFYADPYSDFGRLGAEMWRAVRLVVDTGIHAKGWSEKQAVDYFLNNAPKAEGAVRSEIRRYFVWPGQATTYKIGMLKLLELRALAQRELGKDFDYRAFHDTVLGGGAMPLPVLEARVTRWIERQKTRPVTSAAAR